MQKVSFVVPDWPSVVMGHAVARGGRLVVWCWGGGGSQAGLEPTEGPPAPWGTSDHPQFTKPADGEGLSGDWHLRYDVTL